MKYYSWAEDITQGNLQKFCEFINNNQNDKIILYFQSDGGDHNVCKALISVIDSCVEKIIVIGSVYSGGLYVVYHTKVPVTLIEGVMGMWHYAILRGFSISAKSSKATYTEDICKIKNNVIYKESCQTFAKKIMKKRELKKFEKDKDVYFTFKRMKQIFPDSEII